ncbi:MAG: hypothetical protein WCJ33_00320 [Pseudomonadota bacterium]
MFTIVKDSINQIICTLTEKVSINNPIYLFEFVSIQNGKKYYCIAPDVSVANDRYNEFEITEVSSPNPLIAEIYFDNYGFYRYTIYQQHSTTNLNPANALGVLEIGQMKVLAIADSIETFNGSILAPTVFNGN